MSDKMRWRYGDTNPVMAAVNAETVIEIGDLLYYESDDARPAGEMADQGTPTANQELFASKFLGVAMQRSREGETDPIRVATTGVFEFDCTFALFELGNMVGVEEHSSGASLQNQRVIRVMESRCAIGRVAKQDAGGTSRVLVDIRSTVMTGGVHGSSPASE